jgi:hypothetical protein
VEKIWQKDKKRIKYLQKNNKTLVLWEDDIKNNFSSVRDMINNFIRE